MLCFCCRPSDTHGAPAIPPSTDGNADAGIRWWLAAGFVLAVLASCSPGPLAAQVTEETYARAEAFLGRNAQRLVSGTEVNPQWLGGDRFWYRNRTADGHEFILVDPAAQSRARAFDHGRLAQALGAASGERHAANNLPFQEFEFRDNGRTIQFEAAPSARWSCDIVEYRCERGPAGGGGHADGEVPSPDGRFVAFLRDDNLWIRAAETGREFPLSRDGAENFGYATFTERNDLTTRVRSGRIMPAVVKWAPDSRRIITHRLDERDVRQMHLWETRNSRAVLHSYRYAIPEDPVIPTFQLHIFDVETGEHIPVATDWMDMMESALWRSGSWDEVRWAPDSETVFFTRGYRGYQRADLLVADARTGAVRTILEETSPTWVELTPRIRTAPYWRVLDGGRSVLWHSERDGWGHLYRVDSATGAIHQITSGDWRIAELWRVDEGDGWVYFTGIGREADRSPYFRHLYRARLDGSGIELLSPEAADHDVSFAPSGRFIVDTYSRPDTVPISVVRRSDGRIVQTLEVGDVSRLLAAGWRWPVPFKVKARDGVTDLWGLLYFPPDMVDGEKYPVIDYLYPGPQSGTIGIRGFTPSPRGNGHALSELGFIVFTVDAMGTPFRSKAFNDVYYANMGDNGLPDHVSALQQLARVYPAMDLDRVGITGHSGGGHASVSAMLQYPDLFKVAVSGAGNHDQRAHSYMWSEKYQGRLIRNEDGTDSYDTQGNPALAGELRGKLLLMYGTLDDRVHSNHSLLLIDELIRHNKDFDLVVLPNRNHGFGSEPYAVRRRWDYFVEHLLGETPPKEYEFGRRTPVRAARGVAVPTAQP